MRRIQFRSAPAQKAGPSAASTTQRTAADLSHRQKSVFQLSNDFVVEGVAHIGAGQRDRVHAALG
jgi:hypothetical protein